MDHGKLLAALLFATSILAVGYLIYAVYVISVEANIRDASASLLEDRNNGRGAASMIASRSPSRNPYCFLNLHDCARNATTVSTLLEARAQ